MVHDRHGYELCTRSPAAAAGWIDGADRFLAADGGALEAFERAILADDAFALAHAGRARVLQLRGRMPEAREAVARARQLVARATARERSHVDVLAAMIGGDAAGALERIRGHVARFPRDAFALQPATAVFGLIGFSGRPEREQEAFELLAPLAGEYGDDWWYLGTLGFWHTELGRVHEGLALNRRSIEANPRNGNAAHALAAAKPRVRSAVDWAPGRAWHTGSRTPGTRREMTMRGSPSSSGSSAPSRATPACTVTSRGTSRCSSCDAGAPSACGRSTTARSRRRPVRSRLRSTRRPTRRQGSRTGLR